MNEELSRALLQCSHVSNEKRQTESTLLIIFLPAANVQALPGEAEKHFNKCDVKRSGVFAFFLFKINLAPLLEGCIIKGIILNHHHHQFCYSLADIL